MATAVRMGPKIVVRMRRGGGSKTTQMLRGTGSEERMRREWTQI